MQTFSKSGFHWRADADGRILYRVNEHAATHIITRGELGLINKATEYMAIAMVVSAIFIFAFNGHWWLQGFRAAEFAALTAFVMVIPGLMIMNFAIVRHRILSRAPRAEHDIEITAFTETLTLATRMVTRKVDTIWLWLANAGLLLVAFEIAVSSIRFVRTPTFEFVGGYQPGPLDGLFYIAAVLLPVYLLTDELLRRRAEKPRR